MVEKWKNIRVRKSVWNGLMKKKKEKRYYSLNETIACETGMTGTKNDNPFILNKKRSIIY